jgi:two-component system CheB/CheR fusion protein
MARIKKISPPKKRAPAAPRPVKREAAAAEWAFSEAFPVVGIGASAGGLEAFEEFFAKMPPDSGLAFVLVPHLDPSHASMMSDLLRRVTRMPVNEARDGMPVLVNHVYVIPPNKDLSIRDRVLRLESPLKSHGLRLPIDSFFRSLAQDQKENAVGIIFSGTGSDGTLGIRDIHGSGGMSIVQDPAEARYAGMPSSAVLTGLSDLVLPVDKMVSHLVRLVKQYSKKTVEPVLSGKREAALRRVLALVRTHTGHDFSLYKRNTLFRRLEKRMNLHQVEDLPAYISFLQEHADEYQLLFKDLIIGVTSFFRDPEAFETLSKKALPNFLADKPEGYTLRIWVPACGTGEEAYSLAMVVAERLETLQRDIKIQVFGTDIDEDAISVARSGMYAANIEADVSPDRLRRFFVKEDGNYRVKKEIREMVVFAVQDLVKDPPFTKLDILSCRNLLIYLEPELQSRLLPVFHYSLKTGGLLFLGTSETIGRHSDLFTPIEKKWKIYSAKKSTGILREEFYLNLPWTTPARAESEAEPVHKAAALDLPGLAERVLLEAFTPPSVIVDENANILYIHGQTGRYLQPAPGNAGLNVLDMAREGLRLELSTALHQALTKSKESRFQGLRVKANGDEILLNLIVRPLTLDNSTQGLTLVTFEEVPRPQSAAKKGGREKPRTASDKRLQDMERQLAYTRESLQATIEELQASNEELTSTNEELQSTNEEFQSTNEELETSREELQSMNEELATLNSELQTKIDQLTEAENDMRILLDNTKIGIIFLDTKMQILRFTPEATKVFSLIVTDIGRPVTDIRSHLRYDELAVDIRRVSETLETEEREIKADDGSRFLMKILPYRTAEGEVVGIILTFTDVTQLMGPIPPSDPGRTSRQLQEYAEDIVGTTRQPLVVLDADLRVVSANPAFYETFCLTPEQAALKPLSELGDKEWDIPALKRLVSGPSAGGGEIDNLEVEQDFRDAGHKRVVFTARKIVYQEVRSRPIVLLGIEDLTDKETKDIKS